MERIPRTSSSRWRIWRPWPWRCWSTTARTSTPSGARGWISAGSSWRWTRPAPGGLEGGAPRAGGGPEFEWDIAQDGVFVSERLKARTGVAADSAAGKGGEVSFRFVHPDDAARLREVVETGLRGEGRYLAEYRMIRPDDGRLRWMQGAGVVVYDRDNTPLRVIGVVRDITDRKSEEEHRETLLAELDHRVKNVLAAVQSLAAQSARRTTSTEGFLSAFAGRLKAMASAHELLTATRWRGADLAHIAAAEMGGLAPGQARWEGPDLVLTPRA